MRTFERHSIACAASLIALALVHALHPALDSGSLLVFMAAVAITAALAGLGPALLATALSIVFIDFFFMMPTRSLALMLQTDLIVLLLFGAVSLVVSAVMERQRRRFDQARADALEAARLLSVVHRHATALEQELDMLRMSGGR